MKKFFYNKLIRDKIPQNIRENWSECEIFKINKKDFEFELLRKVGEEASGLLNAKNKKEIIAELADVLDVIEEIKKLKKIEDNQIKQAQENNFKKKGGFTKRIFLVWSSNDKYKTNESKDEKYLKEKNFKRVVKRVKY